MILDWQFFLEGLEQYYDEFMEDPIPYDPVNPVNPDIPSSYKVYGEWETTIYHGEGLCPVKWNQGAPYNTYCPIINGESTLAGCVAVAVAQLMSTYKWPLTYDGYQFSWDEMIEYSFADHCSERGKDGIARLLQHLGVKSNLDMNYGTEKSSAPIPNILRTLDSFGYSQRGRLIDYKTDSIVSDLINGYPILMSGFSLKEENTFLGLHINYSYKEGHEWLLHGILKRTRNVDYYDEYGTYKYSSVETYWYPQCNWGWGGTNDGFYLSGAFDSNQDAVFTDSGTFIGSGSLYQSTLDAEYNYKYKLQTIIGIRK